jgi:O-methyltransferase
MSIKRHLSRGFHRVLRKTGYHLVPISQAEKIPPDIEAEFLPLYEATKPFTMTSLPRMYALYKAIEYAVKKNIPGDIVECGAWKGGSMMLAALALKKFGDTSRHIYLYDTFKGLPAPTDKDINMKDGKPVMDFWRKNQKGDINLWCYATKDECEENMRATGYPESKVHVIEGMVQDTLLMNSPKQIALLRLDLDFYEATKYVLPNLFPRLAIHGVLLSDNYGNLKGERDAIDEYFKKTGTIILLDRMDGCGRIGLKV